MPHSDLIHSQAAIFDQAFAGGSGDRREDQVKLALFPEVGPAANWPKRSGAEALTRRCKRKTEPTLKSPLNVVFEVCLRDGVQFE